MYLKACIIAVLLSACLVARGDSFRFSFGSSTDPFSGSGTLTGNLYGQDKGENVYLLESARGFIDVGKTRYSITKLAPENIDGNYVHNNLLQTGIDSFAPDGGIYFELSNGEELLIAQYSSGDEEIFLPTYVYEEESIRIREIAPTPEPSSIALLGTGLVGVAGFIRKQHEMKRSAVSRQG